MKYINEGQTTIVKGAGIQSKKPGKSSKMLSPNLPTEDSPVEYVLLGLFRAGNMEGQ